MAVQAHCITFTLPQWVSDYMAEVTYIRDIDQRMAYVIEASRRNVEHQTGGPFAAAIFERQSGKLVSLGVNLVTTENLSVLHAEMVAIMAAQKKLGTYDLGSFDDVEYEIITSTEPCAMCLGAIPWSGVSLVISAANDSDARAIGFDEGVKVSDYKDALKHHGIEAISELQREEAVKVLQLYLKVSGHLYNAKTIKSNI